MCTTLKIFHEGFLYEPCGAHGGFSLDHALKYHGNPVKT